jgi:hypothetical protein
MDSFRNSRFCSSPRTSPTRGCLGFPGESFSRANLPPSGLWAIGLIVSISAVEDATAPQETVADPTSTGPDKGLVRSVQELREGQYDRSTGMVPRRPSSLYRLRRPARPPGLDQERVPVSHPTIHLRNRRSPELNPATSPPGDHACRAQPLDGTQHAAWRQSCRESIRSLWPEEARPATLGLIQRVQAADEAEHRVATEALRPEGRAVPAGQCPPSPIETATEAQATVVRNLIETASDVK